MPFLISQIHKQRYIPQTWYVSHFESGKTSIQFSLKNGLQFMHSFLVNCLMCIQMMINKTTSFVNQNCWLKSLDTANLNQSPYIFEPTNKRITTLGNFNVPSLLKYYKYTYIYIWYIFDWIDIHRINSGLNPPCLLQ